MVNKIIQNAEPIPQNAFEREIIIREGQATLCYTLAATVLVIYDLILTFERERIYVWRERFRLPSFIFVSIRYPTAVLFVLGQYYGFTTSVSQTNCHLWLLRWALTGWISSLAGVILLIRVHALYHPNGVLWILIPAACIPPIMIIWTFLQGGWLCQLDNDLMKEFRMTAIAFIIFDATIFFLTAARVVYLKCVNSYTSCLLDRFIRDGAVYFSALLCANILTLIFLNAYSEDLTFGSANMEVSSAFTIILVSRMFLNLRAKAYRNQQQFSTPSEVFRSFATSTWEVASPSEVPTKNSSKWDSKPTTKPWYAGLLAWNEFVVDLPGIEDGLMIQNPLYGTMDEGDDGDEVTWTPKKSVWAV